MSSPTAESRFGPKLAASSRTDIARLRVNRVAQVCFGVALVLVHGGQYPLVDELLLLLPLVALLLLVTSGSARLASCRLPVGVVLFVGWATMSVAWTADTRGSVVAVVQLIAVVAVGISVGCILRLDEIARCTLVVVRVLVTVTLLSVIIAPEWASQPSAQDLAPGWHGPFSHKNGLGAFLILAAAALLVLPLRRRWLWLMVTGVLLIGSQSSTALLITFILVAVVLWRHGIQAVSHAAARRAYVFCSALVGTLMVAVALAEPDLITRALGRDLSLTGRSEIWGAVQRQIAERPLQGWGWGGVWSSASAPTLEMWREARFQAFYAHNGYLDILLQLGVVGFLLFLGVLLLTAQRLFVHLPSAAALWGLLVLLGLSILAFSESAPFTAGPGLLLVSVLATAVLQRPPDRRARPDRQPHSEDQREEERPRRLSRTTRATNGSGSTR